MPHVKTKKPATEQVDGQNCICHRTGQGGKPSSHARSMGGSEVSDKLRLRRHASRFTQAQRDINQFMQELDACVDTCLQKHANRNSKMQLSPVGVGMSDL